LVWQFRVAGVTLPLTYATLSSAFFLGFFLVSPNPIGMQYATEVTYPRPMALRMGLFNYAAKLRWFLSM
jgi:hypothetical protein